ncbi:hypothetical protein HBI25_015660 [Parastagonospora nodorum]|nr:hypothetical protein HBH53_019290 [Parastagonospora nodorum]KAH3977104.1 hypothetical protein HBH52_113700 [Parastagonospora nodorum]KAH3999940.1 hypothetical protein HBI10_108060 [Parastagonospora nodorum]KAH4022322.1 hypothetical protein HBI13_101130 [Parastagonospora nodorum]KAH4027671.1 hypothetical protein HBI09_141690 [Parastagonospora nodorum]
MWLLTLLRTGTPIVKYTFRGFVRRNQDPPNPPRGLVLQTVPFGPMQHVLQNTLRLCFCPRRIHLPLAVSAP